MGLTTTSGLSVGGGLTFAGGLSSGGGTSSSLDPAVTAWVAAVVAAGGSVTPGRATIVNQFVTADKASGAWALTDDMWALWAENSVQALVSLKQLRTATVVAAPTFAANKGYTFNGTSNYINTGFSPVTNCAAASVNSVRLAVYRQTATGGATNAGSNDGTATNAIWMIYGNTPQGRVVSATATMGSNITGNGFAYLSLSRAGTTTISGYYRGVALTTTTATAGAALPTAITYIGARNVNGTASSFASGQHSFVDLGAALSAAQELARYTALQAWATAIGAAI